MSPFKIGDVVRLRSGGPMMTVAWDDKRPGYVACVWFDENVSRVDEFHVHTLTLIEARP